MKVRLALLGLLVLSACESTAPALDDRPFTAPIAGVPMEDIFYGAYFDHDPSEGARDYQCGIKAYDGHRGVDVLLRNFQEQDAGVAVLAAAPGTVASVADGMFDRSTSWEGGGFGNHVVLDHGRGLRTIYAHLREGSIPVTSGQEVDRGAFLGLVGSSGFSNWPHLHFEVRRSGQPVDPFAGPCASTETQWTDPLPYQDQYAVTDAGLVENQPLSLAVLLERPPTVRSFALDTDAFRFWLQVANQRSALIRYEMRAPSGEIAAGFQAEAGSTFSMRYLTLSVPVSGVLEEPGEWEIRTFQDDELIWTEPFTLTPATVADAAGSVAPFHFEILEQVP